MISLTCECGNKLKRRNDDTGFIECVFCQQEWFDLEDLDESPKS